MKTKLAILGLVMAISFLFTQPLAATEVRVVETLGTCAGGNSCYGTIKLGLEVSAGPLKVVLLQGKVIKTSKSFPKGNFEHVFENLCVGTYQVKYYPEQFPVCYKLIENIQVKDEETFSVNILDWIDNDRVKIATNKSGKTSTLRVALPFRRIKQVLFKSRHTLRMIV